MIFDISDADLKVYSQQFSYMTYDFNPDNDLEIKPIVKSKNLLENGQLIIRFMQNLIT